MTSELSGRKAEQGGTNVDTMRFSSPRLFVGREGELQQLRAAFEEAASGHGRLIMLVGEPGIGKTATCEELAGFVASVGGKALLGHCSEYGPYRLPYQPFVEALGRYSRERRPEAVRVELGRGVDDIARIVPAVRDLFNTRLSPVVNPEEDRWRLLEAAVEFLKNAAAAQPLLLVLEDLHDADRDTLDLLLHIARNVDATRLLIVGTYRDVEVDRMHPLAAVLAEFRRIRQYSRVRLDGLSVEDVQRLMVDSTQHAIALPFAELVRRRTDGNPLFVQEMLHFVLGEGLVEVRDGRLRRVGHESLASYMPEGLRDVVSKRLSRLSTNTNQVLSIASVVGREFSIDVLLHVNPQPEKDLEAALVEAVTAGIVEELSIRGGTITYWFTHAFFRQTLYEEVIAPRRIRLHRQIARALEEIYRGGAEDHAAELAEHYGFSSKASDLRKAIRYAQLAARRAEDALAYGEAARQLERASQVQALVDSDDLAAQCDLLLLLGEALGPAGEAERALRQISPEVLRIAEQLGDRVRASHACRLAVNSLDALGAATSIGASEYLEWAERADRYAEPESADRAYADLALANAWGSRRRLQESRALREHAMGVARRLGDAELLLKAAFYLIFIGGPQQWTERLALANECSEWPLQRTSALYAGSVLWMAGCLRLADGDRPGAEAVWERLSELAERTRGVTSTLWVIERDALLAILDGELERATQLLERHRTRADELGVPLRGRQFTLQMSLPLALYLGREQEWLEHFDGYAALAHPRPLYAEIIAHRAVCLAHVGRKTEAEALVRTVIPEAMQPNSADQRITLLVMLLQATTLLMDTETVSVLLNLLAPVVQLASGDNFYTSVGRHMGDAAKMCGDSVAARAYYSQALEAATKIRSRPEAALSRLELAELLLEVSNPSAIQQLEVAILELEAMNMRPALERALRLREKRTSIITDLLTYRERDVAALIAAGSSNREIAQALVISEGTVEVHVRHILSKLGFRSRSQVAVWAAEQGLTQAERAAPPSGTSHGL